MNRLVAAVSILILASAACGKTPLQRFATPDGESFDPGEADAGNGGDDTGTSPDTGGMGDAGDPGECDEDDIRPELCDNGIDEDCDGVADEGCACDYRGEASGVCANGTIAQDDGTCVAPDFHETMETSCDGRDNDCDGQTDEECACDPGTEYACYDGPAGTEGVGTCRAGEVTCTDGTLGGVCNGQVTPGPEACDGADDDCDGVVDEGCSCLFDGRDDGVCATATIDEQGNCRTPATHEVDELSCDGLDNDCDGVVDEACPCAYADSSDGVCGGGRIDASSGDCAAPADYEPEETTCDGKDNDCDGTSDEGCGCDEGETKSCYDGPPGTEGVGVCTAGTLSCVDGTFGGTCQGQATPQSETCDGLDDDCDGVVDEGCPCNFNGSSTGVCSDGTIDATGQCLPPTTYATGETTCDGLDNDCDGAADEGCPCDFDGTPRGVCSDGTIGTDGRCTAPATYQPDETTCDELNNDCDGGTDEGCPCDWRGLSDGVCSQAVRNVGGQCTRPMGFMGREGRCMDGVDNDCNGAVDCDDAQCAGRPSCP